MLTRSALTVKSTVVTANVRGWDVPNVHRVQLVFVLLMEVAGDAHSQGAIKVHATSTFVQPMEGGNVAKRKVVPSQLLVGRTSVQAMEVESAARCQDVTNQHSHQLDSVSSTEEERNASNMDVRKLLVGGLYIVQRMVVVSGASSRDATVLLLERLSYVEHMVVVRIHTSISMLQLSSFASLFMRFLGHSFVRVRIRAPSLYFFLYS